MHFYHIKSNPMIWIINIYYTINIGKDCIVLKTKFVSSRWTLQTLTLKKKFNQAYVSLQDLLIVNTWSVCAKPMITVALKKENQKNCFWWNILHNLIQDQGLMWSNSILEMSLFLQLHTIIFIVLPVLSVIFLGN